MKIKVAIANYGEGQLGYLKQVISEFNSYKKYEVDITVYTTIPLDTKHKMYPDSIGTNLPYVCRKDMAAAVDEFDLFLYNENDMLITEENIDAFLEHQSTLPSNMVSGFIRYELRDGVKVLVDMNTWWGKLVCKDFGDNFTVTNLHQGGWLLTKEQLKTCINSNKFVMDVHHGRGGALEQGASDAYTECGLTKVFPKNLSLLEKLQIRHLPLKYTLDWRWKTNGITYDKLPSS
jgi:hypothetical protein